MMWPRSSPYARAAVAARLRPRSRHRVASVLPVLLAATIRLEGLRRRWFSRTWRAFPA